MIPYGHSHPQSGIRLLKSSLYVWPEAMPLGGLLKSVPHSAQQGFGKVLPNELDAEMNIVPI
jgi:hypothetical protein